MLNLNKIFKNYDLTECKIHGFGFSETEYELLLDIDYIIDKEVDSLNGNIQAKLSPSTLVFKNVWNLNIELSSYDLGITIDSFSRENPKIPKNHKYVSGIEYDWKIETQNGKISFKSISVDHYLRFITPLSNKSSLSFVERGGISFLKEGELLRITD